MKCRPGRACLLRILSEHYKPLFMRAIILWSTARKSSSRITYFVRCLFLGSMSGWHSTLASHLGRAARSSLNLILGASQESTHRPLQRRR